MSPTIGSTARRRRPHPVALFLAAVVAITGCGTISTTPPAATPADFQGIASEIVKRGIAITRIVSGDAGCDDPVLAPTAIAMDASGLGQTEVVRLYVYIFRNRASYDRLRIEIDTCARAYVTDPDTFEAIESSPYVLAGQGPWAPAFEETLRAALTEASGTGN